MTRLEIAEQMHPKGTVTLRSYTEDGRCCGYYQNRNLVVLTGREVMAQLLGGLTTQRPKYIGLGTGASYTTASEVDPTPADDNDVGRGTKLVRVEAIKEISQPSPTSVAFLATFYRDHVNAKVNELRLLTDNDTLVARITFRTQDLTLSSIIARADALWEIRY